MQKHNVKRLHKNKKSTQVGRGGTRGKTSGRGTKGQNARAGHKNRPELRDFIKRIPKLRGRGKNINTSIQERPVVLNLPKLAKIFGNGGMITPQTLIDKKVISLKKGKVPQVKILGGASTETFDTKLSFSGVLVSDAAKKVIESAGGSIA